MTIEEKDRIWNRFVEIMNNLKTEELIDFEKVCPTETSFKRMKKARHDLFDQILEDFKSSLYK